MIIFCFKRNPVELIFTVSGHLHSGNVVIEGQTCKLLDIENWLLGLPSYHRQHVLQFKKIQVRTKICLLK